MNIFWVLSLFLSTVGGVLMLLYALPLKNSWITKLSKLLYRFRAFLFCSAGIYVFLIIQEFSSMKHESMHKKDMEGNGAEFSRRSANLFRNQRNLYIVLIGLSIQLGLLIFIWQSHSMAKRYKNLVRQIRESQNEHHD
ncbi:hypothetical protein TVAG_091340 [Trichomonas vaginalis G3]|uniref:BAP29/BAP31 transmembrane domain-containing protein n=1 Tax=Trichomonas vaginalis (strain ATCC PRA-98 / G3) TaxID=412133 RepID=A2GB04_TRIV3|nr:BAP31/BAP29 transmembrane domain-containing protein family [Trichomonas vaginalis G3]EAX85663.1 hypothetical protein TVAG_091340 [Trichomonas vaginalis G3]KAI5515490.1 BAP31/BAP29 transmembrane domain-containing protein family [Trichomonas vaginalis G3]|eukprot:XP_001298593.1 hypothetical protein [Trichomonas vaginalis G3]